MAKIASDNIDEVIKIISEIRSLRVEKNIPVKSFPKLNKTNKTKHDITLFDVIAPKLDAIEFAFDDAKYGQYSQSPVMEIIVSIRGTDRSRAGA